MKRLRGEMVGFILVTLSFLLFFVGFQSSSIYGGDAGDLVTAAFIRGVAHPPGYPLYTLLGWLATLLPISTIAWRVSLLSSVSAALSCGMLYLILGRLTRDMAASLITVGVLASTYLFWLYAIIPEVFALNILFVCILFYLGLLLFEPDELRIHGKKVLILFFLIAGLALTHHHTILFLFPVFGYLVWPSLRKHARQRRTIVLWLFAFLLGLTPYVYVVWAAQSNPAINWENSVTVSNFFRLITRQAYGTFRSGAWVENNNADRMYQIKLLTDTILIDFSRLGVILIVLGALFQFKTYRKTFIPTFLAFILIGPVFLYYTGFPYILNFYLGTIERFFIAPYIFLAIWLCFGIIFISKVLSNLLRKFFHIPVYKYILIIMSLLPLTFVYANLPKLVPLKNDRTAENLGEDILKTVSDRGVLFAIEDTALFNTQYVYFTSDWKHSRRAIKLITPGFIQFSHYRQWLKDNYTDLHFPDYKNIDTYWRDFVTVNPDVPIYSTSSFYIGDENTWIPYGILKKLVKKGTLINIPDYIQDNEQLFVNYQDFSKSALSSYTHVMLADAFRFYTAARIQLATELFHLQRYNEAQKTLLDTETLEVVERMIINKRLIEVYLGAKKCDEALKLIDEYIFLNPEDVEIVKYQVNLFQDCYGDQTKAAFYQHKLEQLMRKSAGSLENF